MHTAVNICQDLSDQEIIRKSVDDLAYFACLYQRYEARLLRYIHRLIWLAGDEADDVLQDAFLLIFKNLHAYNPAMKASSWIYRIVHNQAISWARKRNAYGRNQVTSLQESTEPANPEPDGEPVQEEHIHQVLSALSPEHREVLILKFLEEMSYAEISDVLKIPEGTVATRINRAKKAFQLQARLLHITFTL
jgi:RNA polymerase sigma-70 factor (ECF subfamily)